MVKVQMTLTMEKEHAALIHSIATDLYEGNDSQALRHILNVYADVTKRT